VTVCANALLQGAVKRGAGSWRKRNIAIGIMLAPVRLLINVVLGAGKYLTGQSSCRQTASADLTPPRCQSPSDAGLFGGIRDLAHRRAFEAYDKAAIRSIHSLRRRLPVGWRDELATLLREATHYKMIVGRTPIWRTL
jgi:hypothetical protein